MRRILTMAVSILAILAVPAGPAQAQGSVAIVGSELLVSPDPAATTTTSIRREGTTYLVEVLPRATPGAGCSGDASSFVVTCPDPGGAVSLVVVQTGDLDANVANETTTPMFARTGAGEDTVFQGGAAPATLIAGSGDDFLQGGASGDVLRGGSGRDRLSPKGGADRVVAGAGPDRIRARDGKRDRVNGGPGKDEARIDRVDRVRGVEREILAG